MKVLAVVGSKGSGKTATVEILTEELTKRGYKVAAVKHIPEPEFTIDRKGKDTWRFAQSGAKTIVSVASGEIATIENVGASSFSLARILQKCRGDDVIFLEGFRELVREDSNISKIITVKFADEASKALRTYKPILAFTSLLSIKTQDLTIVNLNSWKDREKLVDLVEKYVRRR